MPLIAGTLDLSKVMKGLAADRPVFHSEADFQFAFAQAIEAADPGIKVRLEVRQTRDRAEYVDLACWTSQQRTLIEFKYATAGWTGVDPHGEYYIVRHHAAYDLARRLFIHDIHRLEQFTTEQPGTNGLAIMLTNEPGLWTDAGHRASRDTNFRIHEGRTLTGHLEWGNGGTRYDQTLTGTYPIKWQDYSHLDGDKGLFRWTAVSVG